MVNVPETGAATPRSRARCKASNASASLRHTRHSTTRTHRGLTCANCRARKTRCDGSQPGCKTCEVYNDQCRYDKPPPMSQIMAMTKRLQEAEDLIKVLRRATPGVGDAIEADRGGGKGPSPANRNERTELQHDRGEGQKAELDEDESLRDSETYAGVSTGGSQAGVRRSAVQQGEAFTDMESARQGMGSETLISDLSLDEHGKLCYYGPTSAVHDPIEAQRAASSSQYNDPPSSKAEDRSILTSRALESRTWEDLALGNAALQCDIPQAVMSRLLQIHWCWIAPMFMWVYRPAFMRDLMKGGQYMSQFLLVVLCAHSARFQEGDIGEILISRARLLLGTEIQKPSSIPTVQALLQLSARDLAYGSISQAWLYSGMAFRMVSDLGLHHSSARILNLGHLTAEELEIRRRLFWSCYFWDKAISLYLGRMPALVELPADHMPELLDDFAEHELWRPYYDEKVKSGGIPAEDYPPMCSYAISCFQNSCRIAVIINDIIIQLYSRRPSIDIDDALKKIRSRLDAWRSQSPPHVVYDPDNLPAVCPPQHIITQNLLYYTTIILLHRPFYSSVIHHTICRQAADSIEKLLLLIEKTFGFTKITYLMAYCIYTAASAMIKDIKAGDIQASNKMQTLLQALEGGVRTCPIVQRSLDIIHNSLKDSTSMHHIRAANDNMNDTTDPTQTYLPAFPYLDDQGDFSSEANFWPMDVEAFSFLDSFPENHMDSINGEWYLP